METQTIAWKNPEGGVNVTIIPEGQKDKFIGDTKHYIEITAPIEVDPTNNYRDAWIWADNNIALDISLAREISKSRIRDLRNRHLLRLDEEQLIAIGKQDNDKIKEIEKEKQLLRDIPETIDWDKANSAYDLNHIMPVELTAPLPERFKYINI